MTLTDVFHCDACGQVEVDLQIPDGSSLMAIAKDLARVTFESAVTHDLQTTWSMLQRPKP